MNGKRLRRMGKERRSDVEVTGGHEAVERERSPGLVIAAETERCSLRIRLVQVFV